MLLQFSSYKIQYLISLQNTDCNISKFINLSKVIFSRLKMQMLMTCY